MLQNLRHIIGMMNFPTKLPKKEEEEISNEIFDEIKNVDNDMYKYIKFMHLYQKSLIEHYKTKRKNVRLHILAFLLPFLHQILMFE